MGRQRPGRRAPAAWPAPPRPPASAAGALLTSGRAEAARVEQAAIVVGTTLTYGYCPTGRAWHARLDAGRLTWTPAAPLPSPAAP